MAGWARWPGGQGAAGTSSNYTELPQAIELLAVEGSAKLIEFGPLRSQDVLLPRYHIRPRQLIDTVPYHTKYA